jgi:hypothetical protein
MDRTDCSFRRCLWDALGLSLVFGIVVLVAMACHHILEKWV